MYRKSHLNQTHATNRISHVADYEKFLFFQHVEMYVIERTVLLDGGTKAWYNAAACEIVGNTWGKF